MNTFLFLIGVYGFGYLICKVHECGVEEGWRRCIDANKKRPTD